MKKSLISFSLALVTLLSSNSQKLENSTLWKIEGNGLEQASYLFGTIHITCDATLEKDVLKALDQTTQVVLELDMDDLSMQTEMMQGMYMKDGKTLKNFVSEEEYKVIDKLFNDNLGMSVKLMENMKPFFLSAMFFPKLLDCPMQSFETEIMKVAKEQNEEIKGLETVEEQLKVFDDIPYAEQAKDIVRSANDNLAYDRETFKKMMVVYKNENISEMIKMINEDKNSSISKHQDKLLINRNKNWIPRIAELAKEEPTFFVVGAGHLAGDNGVINLLRKEGYTVTAVME